jgi:anti-anti-sigma factor
LKIEDALALLFRVLLRIPRPVGDTMGRRKTRRRQFMRVQQSGETTVVVLEPHALCSRVQETKEALKAFEDRWAGRTVHVELGELDSVGGYGFGLLIQLHKRLEQSGGRLVLRNPTPVVSDMIRVAKLDRFFTIVNDAEGGSCFVVPAE